MTLLLEFKEKLKQIYAKYGTFLLPAAKFILAMAVFKSINSTLNFVEQLDSIFILLILALICSIMPLNTMVVFGFILIVAQCYGLGMAVAGFALALILVMVILYIRFTPDDALVLILTPMAFALKVPCVVPIGCGLTRSPASAIPASFGVVIYYFMELVNQKATVLQGAEAKEIMQSLKLLLDGLMKNQEMMMCIIAFASVVIIVNVIRRLSVDYAWQIAIFAGAISYIVIMVAGGLFVDVKSPMIPLLAGTVGSVILAEILEFFLFNVDYSRTEMIQYEDDEYYYYVKAVPKMSIAEKSVTVKTIQPGEAVKEAVQSEGEGSQTEQQNLSYGYTAVDQPKVPQATVRLDPIQNVPEQTDAYQQGPVPQETISFTGFHQHEEELSGEEDTVIAQSDDIPVEEVDFESRLEESLKEL